VKETEANILAVKWIALEELKEYLEKQKDGISSNQVFY
jgi:hypothetical protein